MRLRRGLPLQVVLAAIVLTFSVVPGCKKKGRIPGVDLKKKILYIGALNDESGPGAPIGRPFAVGKRVLAHVVNEGGSGFLPPGWKIELVEEDHHYNPSYAIQRFNKIRDRVFFIGTSFGTPNTLPLRPLLSRHKIFAFPAALSSNLAKHEFTPPLGVAYNIESMRALEWAVKHAGGPDKVKAGIVYQHDDYGRDGLQGWKHAAKKMKVKVVAEKAVSPRDKDYAAVITALKKAGANYVMLTTLPGGTAKTIGTGLALQYSPIWIGNTPSWFSGFFWLKTRKIFHKYYWAQSIPFWGEKLPGMDRFLKGVASYAKKTGKKIRPDFSLLASYIQGMAQLEAFKRMLAAGTVSRVAYAKHLKSLKNWTGGGLLQPVDMTTFPYNVGTRVRLLKPMLDKRTWKVAAPYETPKSLK